jgi:nuclear pore complex protein Nup98-Nup96
LYLSTHRVEEACKVLIESGNLHLATLVAQIGRDKTSQADLQKQIESWRQHNVLSEMSEPIRALYELLAGNVVRCEGKQSGALEDRASTFTLSERFKLDWFQAFGLRLWYGITEDDPLDTAVFKYLQDVESGNEPKLPVPSLRQHISDEASNGENPLWVLLKIYAVAVSGSNTTQLSKIELPAAFLPKSITGNPLSNRLSFQLHNLITFMVGQNERVAVDSHRQDQLTWDFAWELSSSGLYEDAIFVLLHLSHATDRERGVKEILARFASSLPTPIAIDGAEDSHWQYLTNSLRLPESWLWVSKALYHRDTGDSTAEVNCLIRAKNWNEAHATFCHTVGPKTIIERDYQTLRSLISGFGENPDKRVRGWVNGAAIYDDFLRLAMAESGKRDVSILKRLVSALVVMGDKVNKESKSEGLEERVAFAEMSQVVASWCVRDDNVS